jgi:hypothetical protein
VAAVVEVDGEPILVSTSNEDIVAEVLDADRASEDGGARGGDETITLTNDSTAGGQRGQTSHTLDGVELILTKDGEILGEKDHLSVGRDDGGATTAEESPAAAEEGAAAAEESATATEEGATAAQERGVTGDGKSDDGLAAGVGFSGEFVDPDLDVTRHSRVKQVEATGVQLASRGKRDDVGAGAILGVEAGLQGETGRQGSDLDIQGHRVDRGDLDDRVPGGVALQEETFVAEMDDLAAVLTERAIKDTESVAGLSAMSEDAILTAEGATEVKDEAILFEEEGAGLGRADAALEIVEVEGGVFQGGGGGEGLKEADGGEVKRHESRAGIDDGGRDEVGIP